MLTSVAFKNYRLLRDVRLELGRLNVIVGRNGIGKSTVLEGVESTSRLFYFERRKRGDLNLYGKAVALMGPSRSLGVQNLRHLSKAATCALTIENQLYQAQFGPENSLSVLKEDLCWKLDSEGIQDNVSPDDRRTIPVRFKRSAHLAASLMAPSTDTEIEPEMGLDGSGLAPTLRFLHGLRDGIFDGIERDLKSLVPAALRIRTQNRAIESTEWISVPTGEGPLGYKLHEQSRTVIGARFEVEWQDIGWVPASQLSEGTLLALGLVTLLRHDPPDILLLDDIDKALHPMAQKEVIKLLRRILEQNPRLQIIATAHSPFVLDELSADEVFVAGSDGPGATQIRRLDEHPAWETNKEYLSPGEFWTSVGEDWVGPQPEKASAK